MATRVTDQTTSARRVYGASCTYSVVARAENLSTTVEDCHLQQAWTLSRCDSTSMQRIRRSTARSSSKCRPAMIIGVGGMSKLVHIVDTTLLDAALSSRRESRAVHIRLQHESNGVGRSAVAGASCAIAAPGHLYHYGMYVHANGHDTLTVPPQTASSTSTSLMMEPIACTQSSYDGEGDGCCITIATLHNVWRLRELDTDLIQEIRDDLFMAPVQESLIGQQSSSHDLVINSDY